MKLNILPARAGFVWVKSGFILFFYKPSAFIGFFASFMLLLILLGSIPLVGSYLSMLAFPALNLGMMAVGNECVKLRKNLTLPDTPSPMMMAWLTVRRAAKSLFQLGIWFAFSFAAILLLGALFDGGEFAKFYLQGGGITKELVQKDGFRQAVLISTLLYFPLAGVFWFAPALVNYKNMSLGKSLFFSAYAIFKNWRAFGMYLLVWAAAFSVISAIVITIASLIVGGAAAAFVMMPMMVMLSAIFMASTFATFVDCFQHTANEQTTT
jgi:hypothetical protein